MMVLGMILAMIVAGCAVYAEKGEREGYDFEIHRGMAAHFGGKVAEKTVYNKRLKQKGCGTKHHAGNRKQKKGLHCRCRAFLFLHVAYVLPHNNSATHCKGGEKAVEKGYDKVHERYARHGGFANA